MATIFLEPGTAATQDFGLYTTTSTFNGTITSDAQAVLGSVRSLKCTGTSSAHKVIALKASIMADAGRRVHIGYRTTAIPTANFNGIIVIDDGTNQCFSLNVNPSGNLEFRDKNNTVVIAGSTVLSINTDYDISLQYVVTSGTVNSFHVYLNESLEITVTNNINIRTGGVRLSVGRNYFAQTIGAGTDYIAHIYVDDTTSGDPGKIRVTAKRPFSNGTSNQWTTQIGVGGSGYGTGHAPQVNERPASDTNGWSIQNATLQTEEYTIETISQGDIDITGATIVDFMGWVKAQVGVNSTGNIIVAGVASNIAVTTTSSYFTKIAGSTTYPTGNTDIGMDNNTVNQLFSLFEAGIIIAYIPSAVSVTQLYRMLLGVGQ